jgi:hypothetical protein
MPRSVRIEKCVAACDCQARDAEGPALRSARPACGTRCETVHRPIAGVSTDDQAVSDADPALAGPASPS